MWRHARRPGLLPLATAVLLSAAAGLSLADEHIGRSGGNTGRTATSPEPLSAVRPNPADVRKADMTAAPHHRAGSIFEGVGTRALIGPDAPDKASDTPP
jgi:hypothetical protein